MRNRTPFQAALVTALVAALCWTPLEASALLIEINLPGGNPNEVTRDTVGGLDWLDLTETTSISYNGAVAAATGSFGVGWRHATGPELCALFLANALGAPPAPCPSGTGPFTAGRDGLLDLFGVTFTDASGEWADGVYDDGDATTVGQAFIQWESNSDVSRVRVLDNLIPPTFVSAGRGSWLVRVVPEPSTGLLLGMGLAGLAAIRRRTEPV